MAPERRTQLALVETPTETPAETPIAMDNLELAQAQQAQAVIDAQNNPPGPLRMQGESVADAAVKPLSHRAHAIWCVPVQVDSASAPARLAGLTQTAQKFLKRTGKGGTDARLRCIFAYGCEAANALRIADRSSSGPLLLDSSGATSTTSSSTATLSVCFVFDGEGRIKRSVSRSLSSFDTGSWWEQACAELQPLSVAVALSRVMQLPSHTVTSLWLGEEQNLKTYLHQRIEVQPRATRAELTATSVNAGLDLLGPRALQAHLPLPIRAAPLLLTGPAEGPSPPQAGLPPHPASAVRPPEEALASLLMWEGNVDGAVAADRASKLLAYVSKLTEENAVFKIAAAAAAKEEAKEVPMLTFHACSVSPEFSVYAYAQLPAPLTYNCTCRRRHVALWQSQ